MLSKSLKLAMAFLYSLSLMPDGLAIAVFALVRA
jgi:hypothetical protein